MYLNTHTQAFCLILIYKHVNNKLSLDITMVMPYNVIGIFELHDNLIEIPLHNSTFKKFMEN